ncbi:MAG: VWA domain-containing protein [Ktedonobacteraceae bacterium]|nr:VWA domain-containing protein [Ktedonobacteraceae bacterium]
MNLLVPAAFAFALIIPIILLLYFMRPKRQQRTVASTLLWQQALQDMQASRPWQRLRFTPLLLLQLLAAVFIVLVLVRPAIFTSSSISGNTIIILQASASMQATDIAPSRFESARNDIADMIDNLGSNDHLSLITMANTPQVLIADSNDKAQLAAALQRAKVTNQNADLELALSLANSLVAGRTDMQVLVVGDGHVTTTEQNLLVPFPVHYLRIGTDAPNSALLTLSSRMLQGNLVALAQVANYSSQQRSIPVELFADGREVSVQTVTLTPQATGTVQWGGLPPNTRFLHAQLISQDAMTVDHNAWAIVGGSQKGRVLLVTKGNMFLQAAFALQPDVLLFETTPAQYTNTGNYDLTIFDSFVPPILPSGGLLFVDPPAGSYPFGTSGPLTRVSRISPGDDKMNLLASVDLSSIHTLQVSHQLKLASGMQSIIDAPETPLLVAGQINNQRIAALGFDLHDSDLGLQPSFPILIQNLANWFLPQPVAGDGQVGAGNPVTIQTWPGADQATITGPDQQTTTVGPPFPVIPFAKTDSVGIYQVTQRVHGQFLHGAFTVNLFNPLQSRLAPARTLPVLRSSEFTLNSNGVSRELREIWPWIAALLLLILCAEWWLFSRRYQAQKPAHQTPGQRNILDKHLSSFTAKNTRIESIQKRYILARKQFLRATRRVRNRLR